MSYDQYQTIDNQTEIIDIRNKLDYYTDQYVKGQSEISDEEFDALEIKYQYLTGEKYIQHVADEDGDEPLPFPCGSQDKIKDKNGDKNLQIFLDRYKVDMVNMDKYDGISIIVEYTGSSIKCWKKKNENKGPPVDYVAQYSNFPQLPYKMYIRGELIIDDSDFKMMKPYLESIGMKASHSRNVVNAATSRVNPNTTILPYCKFIPYSLYFTQDQNEYDIVAKPYTQVEQLEMLRKFGFNVPPYVVYKHADINRKILDSYLDKRREEAGYRIDGTILCANIPVSLPTTGDNPNHSVAIKKDRIFFAPIIGCNFSFESKDGRLVPVLEIVPTLIITVVTNVTMYNGRQLFLSSVSKGAIGAFTQGGDIIPKFLWLEKPGDGEIFTPSIPWHWNKNRVELIADNYEQYPQVKCAKLKHFLYMLDVKEWGLLTLWKLFHLGIDTINKIIYVTPEQLMDIGIKVISANNLVNELHRGIKKSNWAKVMAGSGFFDTGLAENMMQKFINSFPNWRIEKISYDQIISTPGFGPIRSKQIISGLQEFVNWLNTIPDFEAIIPKPVKTIIKSQSLSGKVFYFTGDKNLMIKKEIEMNGGIVAENMNKSVNVVVRKDTSFRSSKTDKASESGGAIHLMTMVELDTYLRQLRLSS